MTTTTLPGAGPDPCVTALAEQAMGDRTSVRLAATLKALADPLRLRMLSLITTSASGEACVCDLATVAQVSQPTVSHHLRVLKDVDVLISERRGTWVYYRVTPTALPAVTALLEAFAPTVAGGSAEARVVGADARGPGGLLDADAVLDRVAERLAGRFPDLRSSLVTGTVRESYASLLRSARIGQHVPVLAERFATQRLEDLLRVGAGSSDGAPAADRRPQVLFVCVANAGRSQLAAALLRRHAGDRVVVRSAGSSPSAEVHAAIRPLLDEITGAATGGGEAADESPYPKPLTDDAVRAADVVITMGCGDSCPVLPGKRYEDWAVGDPALASPEGVRAIRDEIDRRVRALVADLLPST